MDNDLQDAFSRKMSKIESARQYFKFIAVFMLLCGMSIAFFVVASLSLHFILFF